MDSSLIIQIQNIIPFAKNRQNHIIPRSQFKNPNPPHFNSSISWRTVAPPALRRIKIRHNNDQISITRKTHNGPGQPLPITGQLRSEKRDVNLCNASLMSAALRPQEAPDCVRHYQVPLCVCASSWCHGGCGGMYIKHGGNGRCKRSVITLAPQVSSKVGSAAN